ncbi:MAG TPA: hypothetical protein DCY13_14335 [Verrucomicrobiales bacterium]|nr:hypothetical protein [Verrucomicrobiales bacterium]
MPDPPPNCVRLDTAKMVLLAAGNLAVAFMDDPLFVHVIPVPEDRRRQLPLLMRAAIELFEHDGVCWAADESARAVLLAQPPAMRHAPRLRLGMMVAKYGFRFRSDTRGRLLHIMGEIDQHRPAARHYHLMLLGASPELRGQAVDEELLRALLETADAEAVGVHVQTSRTEYVECFRRHGFAPAGSARCDRGTGPELMFMDRPAADRPAER